LTETPFFYHSRPFFGELNAAAHFYESKNTKQKNFLFYFLKEKFKGGKKTKCRENFSVLSF